MVKVKMMIMCQQSSETIAMEIRTEPGSFDDTLTNLDLNSY